MNKAVFLDKDGTLIKNVPYNINNLMVEFLPGVIDGLKKLQRTGFMLVVISNQSGIAKGYFTEKEFLAHLGYINSLLLLHDIKIDGWYYCPHHPEGVVKEYAIECFCRKPRAGLFRIAASELSIELSSSFMIGDILDDVEAANRAECKAILVNNGNETEWKNSDTRIPDFIAKNMNQAVRHVTKSDKTYVGRFKYE